MRIAVSGSTGLIGSHLVRRLTSEGHEVLRLRRGSAHPTTDIAHNPTDIVWDPARRLLDPGALVGVDAIVHLAGAPIAGQRWTESYKRVIRDSRVDGTATIAEAIAAMDAPPSVLLSGSASGWYGDTGDNIVDESAPAGSGFLADVVREWEAATAPAERHGVRVVHLRTGVVLDRDGGLLGEGVSLPGGVHIKLLDVFRAGLGGRLGAGRQYLSWISLHDEIAAICFLLDHPDAHGPVNLTAPTPVTNAEFTAALADVLKRPAVIPVPAFALRLVAGQFADDALSSQRILPRRLEELGFRFDHPDIRTALRAALVAA